MADTVLAETFGDHQHRDAANQTLGVEVTVDVSRAKTGGLL